MFQRGKSRALSNIIAEAIMISILASWIAIATAAISVKSTALSARDSIMVPELLYCNSTASIVRVIRGGEMTFDENSTQAFVLQNSSLVPLKSPARLERGDILLLSLKDQKQKIMWFESGMLIYVIDLERQELSVIGS